MVNLETIATQYIFTVTTVNKLNYRQFFVNSLVHTLSQGKVALSLSAIIELFFHSLLGFWETPLSESTKEKLCVIAKIYNGHKLPKNRPDRVYTVASFMDLGVVMEKTELETSLGDEEEDTSPWKLYNGCYLN